MTKYQLDYASSRPQMYNKSSREIRAKRIIKILEDYYGDIKNLIALDLGSSTGIIDNVLADKFKKVIGCDIDKGAVEFAKQSFKKKNLEFRLEDAMNLSFKDNFFDIVICAQVYEHVPNPNKMFDEIYRILKKGGICYFAALNKLWIFEPHYNLPFLSYLPKSLANIYVRATGKAKAYYETTFSYWGLTNLTKKFKKIDYTGSILSKPKKFGYQTPAVPKHFISLLKYFVPTFFWILVKE